MLCATGTDVTARACALSQERAYLPVDMEGPRSVGPASGRKCRPHCTCARHAVVEWDEAHANPLSYDIKVEIGDARRHGDRKEDRVIVTADVIGHVSAFAHQVLEQFEHEVRRPPPRPRVAL